MTILKDSLSGVSALKAIRMQGSEFLQPRPFHAGGRRRDFLIDNRYFPAADHRTGYGSSLRSPRTRL